jgi:SET domain-containing protein
MANAKKVVVSVTRLSVLLTEMPVIKRKSPSEKAQLELDQLLYDLSDELDRNGVKFSCPEKGGYGIKATRFIPKGSFMIEYVGEVLTKVEGLNRDRKYDKDEEGCFLLFFKHKESQLWYVTK